MRERALLFGERKALVGVVTEPAPAPASDGLPAVAILNAGVLHRVGPNRIHVTLARRLAEAGFRCLRFDFSGIGDSLARPEGTLFVRSALQETRQAMDLMESACGRRSFLLVGLCSGADNALRAAVEDSRVVGAALVEGYTVPSRGFLLYAYRRQLLSPRSWARLLVGRSEVWSILRGLRTARRISEPTEASQESLVPSRGEVVAQLHALLRRGVSLCLAYSGEGPAYFNYRTVLRKAVAKAISRGQVRVVLFSDSDHVFTPLDVQRRLVEAIFAWARSARPAAGQPSGIEDDALEGRC